MFTSTDERSSRVLATGQDTTSHLLALHSNTEIPQYVPPAMYHVIVPQRRENGQVR